MADLSKILFSLDFHCTKLLVGKLKKSNPVICRTYDAAERCRKGLRQVESGKATLPDFLKDLDEKIEQLSKSKDKLDFAERKTYEQIKKAAEGIPV